MSIHRIYCPNECYFITSVAKDRFPIFLNDQNIKIFLNVIKFYQKKANIKFHGFVVIPCHIHCLITPQVDDISKVMRRVKSFSSKLTRKNLKNSTKTQKVQSFVCGENCRCEYYDIRKNITRKFNKEDISSFLQGGHVWQSRFFDHIIRNEKDFMKRLNYIHKNPGPEKHCLVDDVENYKYSSYFNYYCEDNINKLIDIDFIEF